MSRKARKKSRKDRGKAFINYLSTLFTQKKKTYYDYILGTFVVERK